MPAKNQKPTDGSWLWPGRNWCWEATKRHACYGRHTWREAQESAAKEDKAPGPDLVFLPALLQAELCDQKRLGASILPLDSPTRGGLQSQTGDVSKSAEAALEAEQQDAESWFRSHVSVYVVNLPSAAARWHRISARLQELGIKATRVAGIDVSSRGALVKAQQDGLVPYSWDFSQAEQNMVRLLRNSSSTTAKRFINDYGLGTVGCAAAHLRTMWQASSDALTSGRPLALILEDDVWLEDDFILKLRRLLIEEAPCDWEVISLRSQCPFGICVSPHLTRVQPDGNEPEEMCRHGVNYGFFAMLYRASSLTSVANKLHRQVWDSKMPGCLANDVALASISDNVAYYAVPASQVPGFVEHIDSDSVRSELNRRGSASWLDSALKQKRNAQKA